MYDITQKVPYMLAYNEKKIVLEIVVRFALCKTGVLKIDAYEQGHILPKKHLMCKHITRNDKNLDKDLHERRSKL